MKYKCIIFDCDGVLVDSETISSKVIVDLANKLGANITLQYAISTYKGTSLHFVKNDIKKRTAKELPIDFDEQYRTESFAAFKNQLKPIHGVKELLSQLNVPICVASNGPLNKMQLNLAVTQLLPYFKNNLFSAYEIGFWKPDPTLFLHAAKTMGFLPKDCLVIEDSLSGIKAAKTAGFTVIALANTTEKEDFKNLGAIVVSTMKEILPLLG